MQEAAILGIFEICKYANFEKNPKLVSNGSETGSSMGATAILIAYRSIIQMTIRRTIAICAQGTVLGVFGGTTAMADSGKVGHLAILDGLNSGAYQYLEDQRMTQIRGAAFAADFAASFSADFRVTINPDGTYDVRISGATAGSHAGASGAGPADANAGARTGAQGSRARAAARAGAGARGAGSRATTAAATNTYTRRAVRN